MGYERKRGKLAALNALLRDDSATESFLRIVGDLPLARSYPLRDYAGYRYPIAARCCAQAGRNPGSSAQSSRASMRAGAW